MYSYRAYGLTIRSALPLPELIVAEGEPDVVIRFGKLGHQQPEANRATSELRVVGRDICLAWDDVGAFLVRDGREIIIEPISGVEERVVRLFILGTTLAMLLYQRGLTVFHASAVAIGNEVVAFAGVKGAGKSTFAAALHAAGYELVADDIVAIDASQGHSMVLPGFPQLKLWPDSINLLGSAPELLPRLRPELEKRSYAVSSRFSQKPLPLRHFCIIDGGSALHLEPLQPHEALTALMPHWYGSRFGMERLRSLGPADFFRQCVGVANSATIYRLKRPRSMSSLADIGRLITKNLMQDTQYLSQIAH
jgi:hypothetical protein